MNILVFNCGSSSLNYKVFQTTENETTLRILCAGKAHRVGVTGSEPSFLEHRQNGTTVREITPLPNHRQAAELILTHLQQAGIPFQAVGHRFVHGGSQFQCSTLLKPETQRTLQACLPLAPIHNPNSLSVIEACQQRLPDLPEYVTFDTAYHATLPAAAYTYPLPRELVTRRGLRKFGFHGLSYQFVTQAAAQHLNRPLNELNLIACHLGTGGSSVAAVRQGQSIDTSMGYSPLAGLMMSTRTGDLDPLLIPYWLKQGHTAGELNSLFNKQSGLLGVSGFSSDIRDCIQRMDEDERAALAVQMYTHRLKKTIGAFMALLGRCDALLFTDDIGLSNPLVRAWACRGLEAFGIQLDETRNQTAAGGITRISSDASPVTVLTVPTDEELVIGLEGCRLLQGDAHAAH